MSCLIIYFLAREHAAVKGQTVPALLNASQRGPLTEKVRKLNLEIDFLA